MIQRYFEWYAFEKRGENVLIDIKVFKAYA